MESNHIFWSAAIVGLVPRVTVSVLFWLLQAVATPEPHVFCVHINVVPLHASIQSAKSVFAAKLATLASMPTLKRNMTVSFTFIVVLASTSTYLTETRSG